jgi:predicted alpha-1,2-mannosidase
MKKSFFVSFLLICSFQNFAQTRLVDYVNPFIGTAGSGRTYPAATLPFGMIQVGPDNAPSGKTEGSSYHYSDTTIAGFSHTHLSGTNAGDLSDISVLPLINRQDTGAVSSSFAHAEERASPGFYGVRLRNFSIYAEMTAALRCALHRYAFPASENASIRFNLGFADSNTNRTTASSWNKVDDSTYTGYRFSNGWAKNQRVFFAVRLSKLPKSTTFFVDGKPSQGTELKGKDIIAYLNFDTKAGEAILMKVGISFADVEGAVESLNEIRTWNFTVARRGAADLWERELRKVQINSTDKKLKQNFYTALYHTYLAPTIFSDRYGNYKGAKNDIRSGKMVLSMSSLWSTFRAHNPLLTITQTEMVPSLINSFLAFFDQHGYLPVSNVHFNETNAMTGNHAVPIIADAILKNLRGFDQEKAYAAMKRSAMQNIRGTESYRNFGFIPADKFPESVTGTLDYSYDDWCLAQVARKLKKYGDTAILNKRAGFWRSLFDERTGFFRGKNMSGKWVEPFNPYAMSVAKGVYAQGTAWQHNFFVPHDIDGLKKSFTQPDGLEDKLDSLFTVSSKSLGDVSHDTTGWIGQYAQSNELCQHAPYIYSYLQKPWKTAERVREIMAKNYNNTPAGLAGNDNFGQLSAWYVFSALGFYPVNPASGEYVLGSPLVDQAIFVLPSGMTFRLNVVNNSPANIYIQSATLNAKPYTKNYFTHHDLMVGGILELKMGDKPNKEWGSQLENIPRSMSLVR